MTAKGVQNLVRYWTGPDGFKAYLARLGNEASNNG
jgi:Na+-transporting NADH:ubiquinone oxidoreductase subunit NqrC